MDIPIAEHGGNHRPKFLQRKKADAVEKLSRSDVARKGLPALLLLLDREVERVADKGIHLAVIARVFDEDSVHGLRKANLLHAVTVEAKPSKIGGPGGSVN